MNNMYKPNLIPVLLLVLLTSLAVACEDNNKGYNDRDNNNVDFPHTPDPEIPNNPDTYTNSVRSSDSTVDSAMRR